MQFNEKRYINRTAIICHAVICIVLVLAYLIQFLKDDRSLSYTVVFALLALVPLAAEIVLFRRNPQSSIIMHVMGICYGALYLFAVFTTTSVLPYTYAFPMFMVIILFADVRFCALIGTGAVVGNAIDIIIHAVTVGYSAPEVADLEIRVASLLLVSIYMVVATRGTHVINKAKLEALGEQQSKTGDMLKAVLDASGNMTQDILQTAGKMEALGESVSQIRESMQEISSGSAETADSVQSQLRRTEEIQKHIVTVRDTAEAIGRNMSETTERVDESRRQMNELAAQVEKSMQANNSVLQQMEELKEYASKMNSIIETITSIANSTGMLALNASIEAARAGEAGRGFAVVASQISSLANQTKGATVDITALIQSLNQELGDVEEAVDIVTAGNRANADSTNVVLESFAGIEEGARNVDSQTRNLMGIVKDLEDANASIVENIQTISAITEEVSAHAGETYSASEANGALVEEVSRLVESLSNGADTLQNLR